MGVKIRQKGKYLYLDIYVKGQRIWERTGLSVSTDPEQNKEVLRLAEVIRSKRELQIVSGEWGLLDPSGGNKSLYQFAYEQAERKNSKNLFKALRYLEAFPGGMIVKLSSVNSIWLENFQSYLVNETGLSQTTASLYATEIRSVLKRAVRELLIARDPGTGVKGISIPESEKIYLTADEIQGLARVQIRGNLGAEIKKGFLLGCFTGLRISDIRSLTWGEIERSPWQIKKRQKKTGRIVYIPLNHNALELIDDKAIHNRNELVFPLLGTTKANTNQYLVEWAQKAGIDKRLGWHVARHTFATLTLENGADFFTVSKLLGHTKVATTAVYTKATDRLKRDAVNSLPEINLAGGDK